ncbi:methyltransferase domain-containing protein [Nisaea acidiphila]|uniref:Methyltransferase domain-containing protein n=1 Tax=Nisaea acidiphila TaxID=1862145 RepID=A0A9J7AZL4_9PROT|nr:methyltransferase domain-containing protein [Nisaea acidiphila]UUX51692.1 methyltransferase domain-containing protein [Nisaea acidiphila]
MAYISAMMDQMLVFDRRQVRRNRDRAAADFPAHDFLKREVTERVVDRMRDIQRRFPRLLDLGSHDGSLRQSLDPELGAEWVVSLDPSERFATLASASGPSVAAEEEFLPFAPASFDAVISCLSLHWVNDLPGALLQARQCLKPDGLFLGAMLGGETLHELRAVLTEAETEVLGGAGPRVSPFAELQDAAGLMQRAGFALPVADSDLLTVTYANAFLLMHELRGMGEGNAITARRKGTTPKAVFMRAAEIYHERHAGPDGRIPASFQVLYLTGWAPHASQQQPLRPGSAAHRLADALGGTEQPAGDPAAPGRKPH